MKEYLSILVTLSPDELAALNGGSIDRVYRSVWSTVTTFLTPELGKWFSSFFPSPTPWGRMAPPSPFGTVLGADDMEFNNILDTPLDYWSIEERLSTIEYSWLENGSPYYDDYADLFNELGVAAADLYNELESLVHQLDYAALPRRRASRELVEDYTGVAWFNTVAALLEETDFTIMLEHEGIYDSDVIEAEKSKRRRAILALPKEQMLLLLTEVLNYVMRFIQVSLAFETIRGGVDELDRLNSFRKQNGVPQLPPSAYL